MWTSHGKKDTTSVGAGIGVGVALGVALGAAMDNMGAGIAIGIAIGAALGAGQRKSKPSADQTDQDESDGAASDEHGSQI